MINDDVVKENRVGSFSLSGELVEHNPAMVTAIMSQMVILKCEYDYFRSQFNYAAYSSLFRSLEEGEIDVRYDINVDSSLANGRLHVTASFSDSED